jgi:mono/diheme cytochrome c family protein
MSRADERPTERRSERCSERSDERPDELPDELPERDAPLPRFGWLVVGLGAGLGALVALSPASGPPPPPLVPVAPTTEAAGGAALFVDAGCRRCHDLSGPDGPLGPSLAGVADRAAARLAAGGYRGGAGTVGDYLAEAIIDHCADEVAPYRCPDLPELGLQLSLADVATLAAYLGSLGAAAAP